jgi:proteasome-associated ATPase
MGNENEARRDPKSLLHEMVQEFEKEKEMELAEMRRDHESQVRELSFKVRSMERKVEEYESKIGAFEKMIERVKQPPLISGYIVRLIGADLKEDEVVLARGAELIKVNTGAVKKEQLKLGKYVWVHPQTYAIVEVSDYAHSGVVAKVADVIKEMSKIVITTEEGVEKKLVQVTAAQLEELKPGFQISVLPPLMEILDVLPNLEVKTMLLGERPNVRYAQIGGLGDAIERIRDVIVLPFQEADLFKEIGLEAPRGVLLYGPPGCGKTLLAKSVATENEMAFFNVSVADILSKWVGESERITKELFRQAKDRAPAIIFFDEIDALFTTRGLLDTSGVHKNIVSQILAEMDGLVAIKHVFVIGATNRPDMMDPALMRPGRFDEIIEIPRPDRKASTEILKVYLTDNLPVDASLVKEHGSKEGAMEALRKYVIDELYGESKWIETKLSPEAKEKIKTVKRKDIVSGAIIKAIVTTAKKNYVKRVMTMKKSERAREGLSVEDLRLAIEEETKEHALTEYSTYEQRQRELFRKIGGDPMVS